MQFLLHNSTPLLKMLSNAGLIAKIEQKLLLKLIIEVSVLNVRQRYVDRLTVCPSPSPDAREIT